MGLGIQVHQNHFPAFGGQCRGYIDGGSSLPDPSLLIGKCYDSHPFSAMLSDYKPKFDASVKSSLTPGMGEPELFLDDNIDFWRFRQF